MSKISMLLVVVALVGTGCNGAKNPNGTATTAASTAAVHTQTLLNPTGFTGAAPNVSVRITKNTTGTGYTVTNTGSNAGTTITGKTAWAFYDTATGGVLTSVTPPTLTSMTPSSGPVGTLITIRGSGFKTTGVIGLELANATGATPTPGNFPAGSFLTSVQVTDTEITGIVASGSPKGLDPVLLEVPNGWGVPASLEFTVQ